MLDLREAFLTPFRPKNILNMMVIPGTILLVGYQLIFLFYKAVLYRHDHGWWWEFHQENYWALWVLGFMTFLFSSVFYILQGGFLFHYLGRVHRQTFENADTPNWFKELGQFFKPGLGLYLFKLVFSFAFSAMLMLAQILIGNFVHHNDYLGTILFTILGLIVFVLAVGVLPLLLGCVVHAIREGSIGKLLDMGSGFELGKAHYKQVFVAILLSLIIFFISSIMMFFSHIITLGILPPYILLSMMTSIVILFFQAFEQTLEPS
jgi:hypothetical protein